MRLTLLNLVLVLVTTINHALNRNIGAVSMGVVALMWIFVLFLHQLGDYLDDTN